MECRLYSDLNAYFRMRQSNRIDSPGKLTECSQLITELQVTTYCSWSLIRDNGEATGPYFRHTCTLTFGHFQVKIAVTDWREESCHFWNRSSWAGWWNHLSQSTVTQSLLYMTAPAHVSVSIWDALECMWKQMTVDLQFTLADDTSHQKHHKPFLSDSLIEAVTNSVKLLVCLLWYVHT